MQASHTVAGILFLMGAAIPATQAENTLALDQIPPQASQCVSKHLGTSKLQSIVRDEENGGVFNIVMTTAEGKSRTFSVDDTGQIVLEEIDQESTPAAVQKTIVSQAGDAKVTKIERSKEDGELEYHVTVTRGSGTVSGFTVEPDGRLSSVEVELTETSGPVRKTIESQLGSRKLESIEKVFDGATFEYEVEARGASGHLEKFIVGANGKLQSVSALLPELSAPAQKTIKEHIGGGKVHEIHKMMPATPKGNALEVYGTKNGRPFNFRVGPAGMFQGQLN